MVAASEPHTLEEMHSRATLARRRAEAAARAHRLKKARALVERSHAAMERMRRTSAGRAALAEAVPPADRAPPFDPAEVFEILDPERLAREPKRIIARVAAEHGFTLADILGQRRQANLVIARHAAVAEVVREHPSLSTTQLGGIFRRDHSTILHALRRAGARAAVPVEPAAPWPGSGPPETILQEVAEAHGVSVAEVRAPGKTAEVLAARRVAIVAIATTHPRVSARALGRLVGCDHSIVLDVLRRDRTARATTLTTPDSMEKARG